MLARFEENWRNGSNCFNAPGERVLGAFLDGRLAGLCGRNRDPYDTHARAGRVRHLYVAAQHRGLGIGRLLIEAVVDGAAKWFDYLNTNCPPEAAAFYERLGFVPLAAEHVTHRLSLSQAREYL
jgi:GNAT superfamily N-acetyltransferase